MWLVTTSDQLLGVMIQWPRPLGMVTSVTAVTAPPRHMLGIQTQSTADGHNITTLLNNIKTLVHLNTGFCLHKLVRDCSLLTCVSSYSYSRDPSSLAVSPGAAALAQTYMHRYHQTSANIAWPKWHKKGEVCKKEQKTSRNLDQTSVALHSKSVVTVWGISAREENILVSKVAMMCCSDKLSVMQQLLNYCSRQECTNMSIHLLRALLLNCEESRLYSDYLLFAFYHYSSHAALGFVIEAYCGSLSCITASYEW